MHGPSSPTGCGGYLENVHGMGAVDTGLRLLPLTGALNRTSREVPGTSGGMPRPW